MHDNSQTRGWYLFEIPVAVLLEFLERKTGLPFPVSPSGMGEAHKWHMALRQGLKQHLHINVGIPGLEIPDHPIEENACALHAALLLGLPRLNVIISGEWEIAAAEGLITRDQLADHERALQAAFPEEFRSL
ncbi:MAG TPA: hypothetical protein VK995_00730 [Oceanipulchritudo sp.]|nr:hypothetical protein [Oceanipulchritudo sp.]